MSAKDYQKDYYKTLGVPKTATAAEIKKAYRELARKYHPDANKGSADAEERFKEITEAEILCAHLGKEPCQHHDYNQLDQF